jgi:tetratricopeptide (TPR) repeat protein
LVAEETGSYRLEVEAKRLNAPVGSYAIRFEELRPATGKDRTLQEARGLLAESARLWRAGKYDAALPPAAGAVEARERALGPEHPSVAAALNNLAIVYYSKDELDKAESLYQRTLKIREKTLGPEHPGIAGTLNNLAEIQRLRGDYAAADTLYRRSIENWEKTAAEHPYIAYPLANLAIVRRTLGDYAEAEQLYQRALVIREDALGPKDPDVGSTLNNLGTLYSSKGDWIKAELMLQRALEIWEGVLGPEHPRVAAALSNLALVEHARGDFDKAEQLRRRAVRIYEKALGPDHADLARSLDNLASTLIDRGDLDQAEPLLQRALAIKEKAQRAEHPDVAISLEYLGKLYSQRSDFDKAEQLYQRALKIREKGLGPDHPGVSDLLTHMAALHAARGDSERAMAMQARANVIIEHNIALNLATGSERQKLAYLTKLAEITDQTLSLHTRATPDNREACGLAATTILQRKGRVQDAMAASLTALRQRFNAQDRKLLDQLNNTTTRLGGLVLNGPQRMTLEEHQKQIKALHPVGFRTVLREDVHAVVVLHEPYFDLTLQPGLSTGCRDVNELGIEGIRRSRHGITAASRNLFGQSPWTSSGYRDSLRPKSRSRYKTRQT